MRDGAVGKFTGKTQLRAETAAHSGDLWGSWEVWAHRSTSHADWKGQRKDEIEEGCWVLTIPQAGDRPRELLRCKHLTCFVQEERTAQAWFQNEAPVWDYSQDLHLVGFAAFLIHLDQWLFPSLFFCFGPWLWLVSYFCRMIIIWKRNPAAAAWKGRVSKLHVQVPKLLICETVATFTGIRAQSQTSSETKTD